MHTEVKRNNRTHGLYVPSIHEKNLDCSIREAEQNRMFRAYPFFQEWHFRILGPSSFSSSGRTANRNNEKKDLRIFFFSQTANILRYHAITKHLYGGLWIITKLFVSWTLGQMIIFHIRLCGVRGGLGGRSKNCFVSARHLPFSNLDKLSQSKI